MKGTLKSFKKVLRESLQKTLEDLDRERRASGGEYENEDDGLGVSYGDRYGEAIELEDSDRVRRHEDGYGDDLEEATPGQSPRAGMKPPHKSPGAEDPFKPLGATGAAQLSRGTKAASAKTDPKVVSQAAVDAVMQILGGHPSSTRSMALTQLKQKLGPSGGMNMPSMGAIAGEADDPEAEPEKKKRKGKSHAAPSEIDVGDTGGGSPGMFGEHDDDDDDERRLGSTFGGDDQGTMNSLAQLSGYDPLAGDDVKMRTGRREDDYDVQADVDEVSPPGKEDMVKALKKDADVDNPWAVAWAAHSKAKAKGRRGR